MYTVSLLDNLIVCTIMALIVHIALCMYVCLFVLLQQRARLKGREKEQMWKELLKVLQPASRQQLIGQTIVIPEQDDFDPDAYGKPVEVVVEGE